MKFTKNNRKELTKLNQMKPSQLTLSDKLKQAILTERLNQFHLKRAQQRLAKIKKLIPLSIGKKLMKDYHVKSYKAFKTMYKVTIRSYFARFQNKPTKSSHNPYSDD